MVIAWSKVFKISQSFIKMFLCFIKTSLRILKVHIFNVLHFFQKKKIGCKLMAQGEVPCDLEMAMGKNIHIAIYT